MQEHHHQEQRQQPQYSTALTPNRYTHTRTHRSSLDVSSLQLTRTAHGTMADDEMSPSPPAPTDPRLPLSAMQVFKLKKSWKGIKRCLDDTGVEMFIR